MKTTNGIKFDIIETDDEIIYLDANGESLTWDNNDVNKEIVNDMVTLITRRV